MSSNAYCAELDPDPFLRRFVLWSGGALVAAGGLACAWLPLPPVACAAAAAAWLFGSGLEVRRLQQAWRGCRALRLAADGSAHVCDGDGEWRPATLLPGGILLRRIGWLRLRTGTGRVLAEPVRGHCRTSRDWRRLQVIWQHVGAPKRSC